jgi:D-cysteine desulfhydrase
VTEALRRDVPSVPSGTLGQYPTPVERLSTLATDRSDFWIKRDDRTNADYGGNKVRKLERILSRAVARGARRIVTVGAAGSHHVLATAYFGRRLGLEVEAVLVPQPVTPHVRDVLCASVATGLRAFPVTSWAAVPFAVAARLRPGTAFVPVGGSNVMGSMGYVDAARELAGQVRAGLLPEPEVCVVALGSGGTAAGLAAGVAAEGLATRVVAVCVAAPRWLVRASVHRLAAACARAAALSPGASAAHMVIDERFLGRGYGHSTDVGVAATRVAADVGIVLDPTYTAKAFAAALWYVRARRAQTVLFWHTLSSAPLAPLLGPGGRAPDLPPRLARLLRNPVVPDVAPL